MSLKYLANYIIAITALNVSAILIAGESEEIFRITPSPKYKGEWILLASTVEIGEEELILDGRDEQAMVIYKPRQWSDVSLSAKFLVEETDTGVLACGFVVRALDDKTFYYVHFDRTQAILVRSGPDIGWNEIRRCRGLSKPAGTWHWAKLECKDDLLRVHLNGKLLYETRDNNLKKGRIGFYANQGIAHVKDIVVTGIPESAPKDFPRIASSFTFVVKDAGAGAYEAFPDVCRLKDGRLLCVFYAGYGHVSLPNKELPNGGRISYCISEDEGRTWSHAKVLYDGPLDDRDPSIVQLDDGRLICNFFSLDKSKEKGKSFEFNGSWMVTSTDVGRTWSQPELINQNHACSSPIRQLSDGSLILGMYGEKDGIAYGGVTQSIDGAKTWSPLIKIDNHGAYLDAETDIIELKDGRLYAVERGGRGAQMHWSTSVDGGKTWTVSKPIGFPAHCPYLHRTPDGIILLGHRIPGTSLHYSLDECKTWSKNVPVDTSGGAYPSMVNLKDGLVLIVYYEEGNRSSIRARRFRVNKDGIEWLRFD